MKNSKAGKSSMVVNALIGLFGLIILVYYLISSKSLPTLNEYVAENKEKTGLVSIYFPQGSVYARIATSSADLERGLSGTSSLSEDEGMLFVFDIIGERGFWMRDMAYPIDIVWINSDKTVIGISSDIDPGTYPNIFFPPGPVKYVLELNAGFAEENKIATGTPLTFVI
jgi:uncharacterized membrane protein (UPF0127 family)